MIRGFGRTLAAAVLSAAAGGVVLAADGPVDAKVFDKMVVDALRDVHNYGADLYNMSKDYAASYRVYEGALKTVRPLLGHRPAVQKLIDEGTAAAAKEGEISRRAYLLHETIEKVRAELRGAAPKKPPEPKKTEDMKAEPKKVEPPKKAEEAKAEPPKKAEETKKPVEAKPKGPGETVPPPKEAGAKGEGASVSGVVTFEGKALAAGEVTFLSLDQKAPKVVTVAVKDGKYSATGLPPGKYKVTVAGGKDAKLPAKYATADTSGLTVEVKAAANALNFELK